MDRLATPADVEPLSHVVARAFHDDPPFVWSQPNATKRERRLRRMFAGRLRTLVRHDISHTTDERDGVALWAPPGRWRVPPAELVHNTPAMIGPRVVKMVYGLSRVEAHHPRDPHLYLAVLGVDPARQGQGIGSRLLRPGLELCDAEGLPAYLETAKERNLDFYGRHGFRVTGRMSLPRGGPPIWLMWRDPR